MDGIDYDEIRETYEGDLADAVSFSGRDVDFFARAKARVLLDVARRRLGPPRELCALDVGCGIGLVDGCLAGSFGTLVGTDVTPGVLAEAARRNPDVRYELAAGGRLPFEDGVFDLVFTVNVLQVLEAAARPSLVAELARVTRPGGLAVAYEHNPFNPLARLVVRRCSYGHDVAMVGRVVLMRLLRDAGLVVVEHAYVLVTPWESRPALAVERALRRVPFGAQQYVAARRV